MVGGTVIGLARSDDSTLLHVEERGKRLAVRVVEGDSEVRLQDRVWWQGRTAYWTPASADRRDVPLPRIGYSH